MLKCKSIFCFYNNNHSYTTGSYFPKKFLNYKLQPISRSIKKYSILTHMAKKLQARQFLQYCLVKKASGSKKIFKKNCFSNWSEFQILSFYVKKFKIYEQNTPNFSPKIKPKILIFTPLIQYQVLGE